MFTYLRAAVQTGIEAAATDDLNTIAGSILVI